MSTTTSIRRSIVAIVALSIVAQFAALLGACAGDHPSHSDGAQHARCLPCVKEGDLPCIDVRVDPSTPRAEWGGVTYYFCSQECRRMFLKDPQTYVALEHR